MRCVSKTGKLYPMEDFTTWGQETTQIHTRLGLNSCPLKWPQITHTSLLMSPSPSEAKAHTIFTISNPMIKKKIKPSFLLEFASFWWCSVLLEKINGTRWGEETEWKPKTHPHTLAHPVGPESPDNRGSGKSQPCCHRTHGCHTQCCLHIHQYLQKRHGTSDRK